MKKVAVVALIFVVALSALVWVGIASAIPVLPLARLTGPEYQGGNVEIKDARVARVETWSPLRFSVTSRAGSLPNLVWVETPRSIPENFKEGNDIGLQGSYDRATNTFHAYRLTTACPSKYEASKEGYGPEGGGPAVPSKPGAPGAPVGVPPAVPKGVN
jgi:cytochrome c-type biogenesis protein CcmE